MTSKTQNNKYEKKIKKVVTYFDLFNYAPNFDQIHTYIGIIISKKKLKTVLNEMVKEKLLVTKKIGNFKLDIKNSNYYALPGHSVILKKRIVRVTQTKKKVEKVKKFTRVLKHLPHIELIGLSGSCAMANAKKNDDIDLFIITSKNRLWTGRFVSLLISQLFGMRRKRMHHRACNKACMNLFFDKDNVQIPKHKQNLYTAHEVVQMRPLYVRGGVYQNLNNSDDVYNYFLSENKWVAKYFPNIILPRFTFKVPQNNSDNAPGGILEKLLKKVQLSIMSNYRTTEIITDTQLWFFPDDYEKKIDPSFLKRET